MEINIEDIERAIYSTHLQEKDNRFANAFKVLLLRKDFYSFLSVYKERYSKDSSSGLEELDSYISKLESSAYFKESDKGKREENVKIIRTTLQFYYPYFIFKRRLDERLVHDPMLNFPKINYSVFYEDNFNKYFPKGLYMDDLPTVGEIPPAMKKFLGKDPDRPRLLQIICEENVGKEELINYINTFWGEISLFLNKDSKGDGTRDKASKTFLRDVDIYNTYQGIKGKKSLQREYETVKLLKETHKETITEELVRKTVANISKLYKEINS